VLLSFVPQQQRQRRHHHPTHAETSKYTQISNQIAKKKRKEKQ
jgi:hypothetical protein